MNGKKQFLSVMMVLAFVVALSASGVWGQDGAQGPEAVGPESPELITHNDNVEINGWLRLEDPGGVMQIFLNAPVGTDDWMIESVNSAPDYFEIRNTSTGHRPFRIEDGAGDWTLFWEDTGDVGLGTNSPSYNLDVQGTTPSFRVGSVLYYHDSSGKLTVNATGDAIRGFSNSTSDNYWGVWGQSKSPQGEGVMGVNIATTGVAHGVYGETQSASGIAVEGLAYHTTGTNYGVRGRSRSTAGAGVFGLAKATTGTAVGVYGKSVSATGRGVYGLTSAATGATYGVYGRSQSTSGRGLYGLADAASGST